MVSTFLLLHLLHHSNVLKHICFHKINNIVARGERGRGCKNILYEGIVWLVVMGECCGERRGSVKRRGEGKGMV